VYWLELGGDEDAFAACEAESAAVGVEVVAPGLARAGSVRFERVAGLAYTRAVCEAVARSDASVDAARTALEAASVDRTGSVAVRARDVRGETGVSTSRAERELGAVLVDRGFSVDLDDPDHELRALFTDGVCLLGWLAAESVRDFGDRRPSDRPFFQPGGMAPLDARAFANIAGAGPGTRLLDPMCGTGGVLIEAGLVGSDVVGSDAQWKMVRGSLANLDAYLGGGADAGERPDADAPRSSVDYAVARADATDLPFRDDAFDAAVFDVPYGRQSKVARHDLRELTAGALAEAARVCPRAVVVADRSLHEVARETGWRLDRRFERRVHRSLTRHVHVLDRAE
jgi:tRNA (guanine10-N2)-dimethyltransferase